MIFYILNRNMDVVTTMSNETTGTMYIDDTSGGQTISLTSGVSVGTYDFKVDPYVKESIYIKTGNFIAFNDKYNKHRLYTIMKVSGDDDITAHCEDIGLDLINEYAAPWDFEVDQSFDYYLNQVFGNSDWVVEYRTNGLKEQKRNLKFTGNSDTKLKRLEDVMAAFDCECDFEIKMEAFRVTKMVLNVYKRLDNKTNLDTKQRFLNDINLVSLTRSEDITDMYTAVIATGAEVDGKTLDLSDVVYDDGQYFTPKGDNKLYDRKMCEIWSRFPGTISGQLKNPGPKYIVGRYSSNTTSAGTLFSEALDNLKEHHDVKLAYEAKLLELDADLGDYIEIVDSSKQKDVYLRARVQQVTNYYTQVGEDTGVLANYELMSTANGDRVREILNKLEAKLATIKNVLVTYQIGDNGTTPPSGKWTDDIPDVPEGKFLWTKTEFIYSNGTTYTAYSNSKNGINGQPGKSIIKTSVSYQLSDSGILSKPPTGDWVNSLDPVKGKYLWTRTIIYYSDGGNDVFYTTTYQGYNGRTIQDVENYYLISDKSSGVTVRDDGWGTSPVAPNETKRYLWNYEKIFFEENNVATTTVTTPAVIGMYSTDGVGVQSVNEYYQLTEHSEDTPKTWIKDNPPLMTQKKKYLWNYEVTVYTNGTTSSTEPAIIGIYGETGPKGDKGDKGDDAIALTISATDGTIFKNNNGSTALVAHVFIGGSEQYVSADGKCSGPDNTNYGTVIWYKGSETTGKPAKSILVNASDVNGSLVYKAQLEN